MTDVNIKLNAQTGDVTGLKTIENGYQNLIQKSKQAYQAMQRHSPMQMAADRQAFDRKMADLDQKGRDLERKIASSKLDMAITGNQPNESFKKMQKDLEITNLQRDVLQRENRDALDARRERQDLMGDISSRLGRTGRFVGRKAARYGGAVLGLAGVYSIFSNVGSELGGVDERNLSYATALSSTRNRQGMDYSTKKPFFEVQKIIEELGQTAYMTSKDMLPLLNTAKDLADFSKGGAKGLVSIANIGKSLGVDTGIIDELLSGAIQHGNIKGLGGGNSDMIKMLMFNQNIMYRSSESLQAMSQVLSGATHGTQGVGAFGIFNLLDTLNSSKNRTYWGSGGSNAALRIDQAFRSGGDESFQYMQTLALNPAFQSRNARLAGIGGKGGKTNWGSGAYDQLMADMMKELGAFATPQDLMKAMKGMGVSDKGSEAYINKMYGGNGGMNKMNIERLFDVYSGSFGAGENSGRKFFMQMQMARSMGVSPTDIGVIGEAIKDRNFMARAKSGKLGAGEYASAYESYKSGGQKGLDQFFEARSKNQESMISIAQGIRDAIDKIKPVITDIIGPAAEMLKEWLPEMAKVVLSNWGSPEQKKNIAISSLKDLGMGLSAKDYEMAGSSKSFNKWTTGNKLLDFILPMGKMKFHEEISGISPYSSKYYDANRTASDFPDDRKIPTIPGLDPKFGLLAPIVEAIKKGFEDIQFNFPPESGTIALKPH